MKKWVIFFVSSSGISLLIYFLLSSNVNSSNCGSDVFLVGNSCNGPSFVLFLLFLFFILPITIALFISERASEYSEERGFEKIRFDKKLFKIIVLIIAILMIIRIIFLNSLPFILGGGLMGLPFLIIALPVLYLFYPIYLIILFLRYRKEKSNMNNLDKITFYVIFAGLFIYLFSAMISQYAINN